MGRYRNKTERQEAREKKRAFILKKHQLKWQYRQQVYSAWGKIYQTDKNRYRLLHRHIKYARPAFLGIMIAFWTFLIIFGGLSSGSWIIAVVLALISTVSGVTDLILLSRMDNHILRPLTDLEQAAVKIAGGNFSVTVPDPRYREMKSFVQTFNNMAESLHKSSQLKKGYEENRKELIANISHDLKTPVTAVLGYVDALHDIAPSDRQKTERYLSIIKSNTVYLNRLIDDLFLFSKLDIHKLEFNFEPLILNNYLSDLMEEFALELKEQHIQFSYRDLLPGKTPVRIDPKQFCRVLRNIIDNARRYGPEEGLSIIISAVQTNSPGDCPQAQISITDNGPGISESKLSHLFERFYRTDEARTKATEGTGLGLAIARELIEAHHGTIAVQNEPAGGLTFTLTLPIIKTDDGEIRL